MCAEVISGGGFVHRVRQRSQASRERWLGWPKLHRRRPRATPERDRTLGCYMERLAGRRRRRRIAKANAWATSSACTWCNVSIPRFGRASSWPVIKRSNTDNSRFPAGFTGTHPGPDDVHLVEQGYRVSSTFVQQASSIAAFASP